MKTAFSGNWLLCLFWLALIFCYYSVRQRKAVRFLLNIFMAGIAYYSLQILCETKTAGDWLQVVFCVTGTFIIGYEIADTVHWYRSHISEMSVKYAVDALPAGICCYDNTGRILLKNKTMEHLCRLLTDNALLNGITFEQLLFEGKDRENLADLRFMEAGDNIAVVFPAGEVYEFKREEADNREYVLTAFDITEEYRKTQTLLEKQQTVTELNQRLKDYNREILSVISAKEVLNAKVKIHDELGACLLRVRKYLKSQESADTPESREKKALEKQAILDSLQQNLTFLQREVTSETPDEYEMLLKTAGQLAVKIEIEGRMPEEEILKNICVTALHECLTNTIRHAGGNLLKVIFRESGRELQAVYTNNGTAPAEKIVEKGGLKSLRNLVEQAGGRMEIASEGEFRLTITLKTGGEQYGI